MATEMFHVSFPTLMEIMGVISKNVIMGLSGNGHQNDHFGWGFLDGKPLDYPLRKSLIEGWDMRKLAYRLYKLCPPPFTNCQDVDEWF